MAIAVDDIVTRARRRYPNITSAIAIEYLNEVHTEVCQQFDIDRYDGTVNLVADTAEVTLPTTMIQIETVFYVSSATLRSELGAFDIEQRDQDQGADWRYDSSGTPTEYALSASTSETTTILLHPAPDTTTSAGYPVIRVIGRARTTLVSGNSLPEGVLTADPYVAGIWMRFAQERDIDSYPAMRQMYVDGMHRLQMLLSRREGGNPVSVIPSYMGGRSIV